MRLTLRTLLAWKDDTLEPHQVREIGRQVAESPFAQELSERIDRVTRQRRLTVPSSSGADATDPNIVAGYLDNGLDSDDVAEFEKRCLTSDVNLAEAASVHQILSLLGQKVRVPDGVRARMYQLVKGREAIAPRSSASSRPVVKEPVTKPIQPWVLPEAAKRPWIERFGPAAACLLLICLATLAAWKSLSPPPLPQVAITPAQVPAVGVGGLEAAVGAGADGAAPAGEPKADAAQVAASGQPANAEPDATPEAGTEAEAAETAKKAKAAELAKAKPAAPPVIPAGSAGVAEKADGILLRYNEDRREWERLVKETSLKASDRLLCLEPFRASIDVGKVRIGLVRETEIRILSQPSDPVPAIELVQGKLAIRQPGSNALKVVFAKQSVNLEMSSDTVVGMERLAMIAYGQPVVNPQSLGILCQQGEVTVTLGGKPHALKPMDAMLIEPSGQTTAVPPGPLPPWVSQVEPSPFELQLKDQFFKVFHADRPVLAELVAAIDDDKQETKNLAIAAIKSLGDLSLLMPTLSRENDPVARRATIASIRSYMWQGPDASGRVRAALDEQFGEELGGVAQHMLIGFTPDEMARPDLLARLVGLLSPEQESLGIRELALYTLKALTGRDDLGYDPDQPAGKGFDAWKDLLRRNELRPLRAAPAPTRPPKTKAQR